MKPPTQGDLTDLTVLGNETRHLSVRGQQTVNSGDRHWLIGEPECALLRLHQIAHVGIMRAKSPYEIVRTQQSGTYLLACFEGEGEVLADGAWKRIRAGNACLLPPFVLNALRCIKGKPWHFAWVRYEESREVMPIVSSLSPVAGPYDPLPIRMAIEGLHAEASGVNGASMLHHWTELIHQYVLRFAQPKQPDDRLWRVWHEVEKNPARNWSLTDLAALACVSEEHLRRMCRKQLGRSPMQHLTFLRMQRARHLLSVTDDKIEVIARAVGFKSVFSFSNIFKKWIGWRPSEQRLR